MNRPKFHVYAGPMDLAKQPTISGPPALAVWNLDLLRQEFPGVIHKRVYRLYKNANLAVRRRKKVKLLR